MSTYSALKNAVKIMSPCHKMIRYTTYKIAELEEVDVYSGAVSSRHHGLAEIVGR